MIAAREAAAGAAGSSSDVKLDVNAYGAKRDSSSEEESDVPDVPPEMVPQEVVLDQDLEQLYLSEAKKCLEEMARPSDRLAQRVSGAQIPRRS